MDLLTGKVSKHYFHYLWPSLFSGLVTSVYVLVDMVVVGQYEGAIGTAALACVAPFWPLFCCVSLLFGLSGSVLFSKAKGEGNDGEARQCFTAATILMAVVTAAIWLSILLLDEQYLRLFGADDSILPMAMEYMKWLKWGVPLYPMGLFLSNFVRCDGSPTLAGASVIAGGVLNIVGDVLLVFTAGMGIAGAAVASVAGQLLADILLAAHFFKKGNTLAFGRVTAFWRRTKQIVSLGFSAFVGDISMSFLTMLFNNQIMRYFGAQELAIYGIGSNLFTTFQTLSYGTGNAAQPIIAQNYGAGNWERIRQAVRCGAASAVVLAAALTGLVEMFPAQLIRIYMSATEELVTLGVPILRAFFLCLLFMPVNIFATYCLQAVMKARQSLAISALRGIILSGALIYLMPALFGPSALWYAMAVSEVITILIAVPCVRKNLMGGGAQR